MIQWCGSKGGFEMPVVRHKIGFSARVASNPGCLNGEVLTYAIWDGVQVKVGKCTTHPRTRMDSLQTGNPRKLALIGYTTTVSEARVLRSLPRRLTGEWFAPSRELLR